MGGERYYDYGSAAQNRSMSTSMLEDTQSTEQEIVTRK